jgi:transposase
MPYKIAGIDVHKKMLAVVIADIAVEGEYKFSRRRVGTRPSELRALAELLVTEEVDEVVMESTAQYWRPVWETLERAWTPQCRARPGAGAQSGTCQRL